MSNILEIEGLSKSYDGKKNALNDCNFSLEKGEICAIVGESGSGKTTLLRLIAGLERPTNGCIKINGQLVEKGEYHVYSVPGESKIDLVIYEKTSAWGSLKSFDESLIKARVTSDFYDLPFTVETFTLSLGDISNAGASLNLLWDNKAAVFVIDALTKEKMITNINEVMSGNPSKADYQKAAIYFYEEDIDINKALKWIDIALPDSKDLKYWQLRYKAIIYEKAGKMKKAKKYAKQGYEIAKKANSPDAMNTLKIVYDRLHN